MPRKDGVTAQCPKAHRCVGPPRAADFRLRASVEVTDARKIASQIAFGVSDRSEKDSSDADTRNTLNQQSVGANRTGRTAAVIFRWRATTTVTTAMVRTAGTVGVPTMHTFANLKSLPGEAIRVAKHSLHGTVCSAEMSVCCTYTDLERFCNCLKRHFLVVAQPNHLFPNWRQLRNNVLKDRPHFVITDIGKWLRFCRVTTFY